MTERLRGYKSIVKGFVQYPAALVARTGHGGNVDGEIFGCFMMKEEYPEQAQKLDVILGLGEQCGNSSESSKAVRRMLEEGPEIKKRAYGNPQALDKFGSGGRI